MGDKAVKSVYFCMIWMELDMTIFIYLPGGFIILTATGLMSFPSGRVPLNTSVNSPAIYSLCQKKRTFNIEECVALSIHTCP